MMTFENLKPLDERTLTFTLTPTHVTYANTLRRLILTGVETVAFRADMTSTGSTTDVFVTRNDTPMTNEMLADRIGLLPIYVTEPLKWNADKYLFKLHVSSDKDNMKYVKAGDFTVIEKSSAPAPAPRAASKAPNVRRARMGGADENEEDEENEEENDNSNDSPLSNVNVSNNNIQDNEDNCAH